MEVKELSRNPSPGLVIYPGDGEPYIVRPEQPVPVWMTIWRLIDVFTVPATAETALAEISKALRINVSASEAPNGGAALKALTRGTFMGMATDNRWILGRKYRGMKCSSPLQAAILNWPQSCGIVQLLIDHGSDVSADPVSSDVDSCGSALQAAVIGGSMEMVQLILAKTRRQYCRRSVWNGIASRCMG